MGCCTVLNFFKSYIPSLSVRSGILIFAFGKEKFNIENIMFNISDICFGGPIKKARFPWSGNPAVSVRSVAFRPRLAAGLALICFPSKL